MSTNLPNTPKTDSASGTKLFFNSYGSIPLEYSAADVDATIGFFRDRGFDDDAALMVGSVLLRQAKVDGTPIFKILDTLSNYNGLQCSALVGEILNNDRASSSTLGFRTAPVTANFIRNISA